MVLLLAAAGHMVFGDDFVLTCGAVNPKFFRKRVEENIRGQGMWATVLDCSFEQQSRTKQCAQSWGHVPSPWCTLRPWEVMSHVYRDDAEPVIKCVT